MKRSKKYTEAAKDFDKTKSYSIEEAVKLAKAMNYTKFTGSMDVTVNLNVPTKKKNESVRGSITLPHQEATSNVKVVVVTDENNIKAATAAGADEAGEMELIKKIEGGYTDFDVLIATPNVMAKMAKLGKVLGPKGLMPNPKNETVTTDLERVIKSYKSGKLDYKMDDQNAVKLRIGKLDLTEAQLIENLNAFMTAALADTKMFGPNRLKSIYVSPTMGPSVKIEKSAFLA